MAQTQAARDLKDLRALRQIAQRGPSAASYVIWGSFAVCAVVAAAFTIALGVSANRGTLFTQSSKPPAQIQAQPQIQIQRSPAITEHEIGRLNDAIRALAAERDRLAARLDQVERSVGDITAAIPKVRPEPAALIPPAAPAAEVAPPAPAPPVAAMTQPETKLTAAPATEAAPAPAVPAAPVPAATAATAQTKLTAPAAQKLAAGKSLPQAKSQTQASAPNQSAIPSTDSIATRTEFAVDLGGEATMDGLRALWATIRGNHGAALQSLRPLVSVREGAKPGTVELRLVAGPLANAGAAAKVCAGLQAKGVPCQTTVFDGQRLALR
jgi:hypothetical protein